MKSKFQQVLRQIIKQSFDSQRYQQDEPLSLKFKFNINGNFIFKQSDNGTIQVIFKMMNYLIQQVSELNTEYNSGNMQFSEFFLGNISNDFGLTDTKVRFTIDTQISDNAVVIFNKYVEINSLDIIDIKLPFIDQLNDMLADSSVVNYQSDVSQIFNKISLDQDEFLRKYLFANLNMKKFVDELESDLIEKIKLNFKPDILD